ncbi:MAG: site-specific integrase, partial [Firmicutes bacterium]|nr:site-specific integrase [Bacillota bacterium]
LNVKRQVTIHENFDEKGSTRFSNKVTTLKSSNAYRTIPLPSIVMDELKIHKKWHIEEQMKNGYRTDFVFTTESGKFYDLANINRALDRYYKGIGLSNIDLKTGKRKESHTYRRTFGTNLAKKGVPITTLCKLMGHSDISVTAKYYIGIGEEEKRKAIELLANAI